MNCLRRGQKKRQDRQKSRRLASTYSTVEQLEDRTLLAGASLVNIEPNIDLSLTDGEVYNEAPNEFTFKFSPGQQIDAASLGGIQFVRSGLDGTFDDGNEVVIQPGYIGIGDEANEVIVRFAESLPDDNYQITIFGTGVTPLLNQNGEAFQDGVDQVINFELDLGAKVVAVVSQPILRGQNLTVDDVADINDGDLITISVGGAQTTFEMDLNGDGLNDPSNIQVIYTPTDSPTDVATAINDAINLSNLVMDGYITTFQNGAEIQISGNSFTPAIGFSLVDSNNAAFSRAQGDFVAKNDQILIYFNDDDLNPDLANDSRFYQVIDTSTDTPIDPLTYTATYDPLSDVTVLEFANPLTPGQQYRLRVGVSNTPDEITTENYTTADSETITILAGAGGMVTPANGMLITDLILNDPSNLVIDGAGNYYFVHTDSSDGTIRILRVDHQTNEITIIAGTDGTETPADNVLASELQLMGPQDLALDVDGNLYLTVGGYVDGGYVLKIDSVTQLVTVLAGGGIDATPDLGDVPTDLQLDTPAQLTVDGDGNVYFHDSGLNSLILIDANSGLILGAASTVLATSPFLITADIIDLEVDALGNLYAAVAIPFLNTQIVQIDTTTGGFITIAGDGAVTDPTIVNTLSTDLDLSNLTDMAFDADGFLNYSDSNGYIVRFNPYANPAERFVEVITGDGGGGSVSDGEPAATADLNSPTSLAIGTGNTPYFFDNGHNLLLRVENLPDQNSAFDNATDLTASGSVTWDAGTEEFVITSEIQPQGIGLPPLPGGTDEPGHRQLPATLDSHVGSSGTNPVVGGSISVIGYNFQDSYGSGFDVQGNPVHNAITEEQKQRTREIFEIYAYYLGVEFIESADQGITIVTGDLRVANPGLPVGPGGVAGVSTGPLVIMDSTDFTTPEDDVYGGSWMNVAFHEIGHSLGLGHSYDIPSIMGDPLPQDSDQTVFPGDHDLAHLQRLYRADANDIDLYQFHLDESGTFRAEVFAERLDNVSLLNSALTLFDENHNVIARNDDYFSNDSFLELTLAEGTYFIGITSTGNLDYNPEVENSGDNGTTDGHYELRLNFSPDPVDDDIDPANIEVLLDESGTQFDGDSDGTPGGAYDFWFVASDPSNTIYVDKTNAPGGDGTLGNAYSNIAEALNNVTGTTEVIRILGNGGEDGDLRTTDDSYNYLIGYDDNFTPLEDGESIVVPQGVTMIIDQGAVIKLQNTVIDVGSSSVLEDRGNAALQVLGTPDAQVVLTSYGNDAIGGDDDGPSDGANAGDWGGIIFRADSDYEENKVFLNYVANADISYGGGQVYVDSVLQTFAPIHVDGTRPTLAYNTISYSANAAISADPDSFDETIIDGAGNYNHDQTLKRIGLDIYGNTIVNNSLNGLFIRTETLFGQEIDKVEVTARFDDYDIVHIITENLFIDAGSGGPVDMGSGLEARYSGSVRFDPGLIVKLGGSRIQTGRGNAGFIAEGTEESPIIFTSIFDDRYGAGGTFDTTNNDIEGDAEREAMYGDWGGIILNQTSHGSIDHAVIAYAGGVVPIEGFSDSFNAIEVHQADLRITNTLFENNDSGASTTNRNNLGRNEATTIFVRGAQPIIVNNSFVNNNGSVIDINANSLKSNIVTDYGRSTGVVDSFDELAGNSGPLVRLNRFEENRPDNERDSILGMVVRGEVLTVESVWDDIDIDHVVFDTITVDNFHTYGGLRLQSSTEASLVVKFGANAGFTATGHGLDINDRIGGIVQIIGDPQNPVVLTSINDDTIGSGIGVDGFTVTDTVTGSLTAPAAGDWTGLQFLEFSHDRNVALYDENELTVLDSEGNVNGIIRQAQFLGELAPDEQSGDENRRLGFEVHGSIAANDSTDTDIYSFNAEAGTEVWIDIDRTGLALDTVIELLDPLGRVLAIATNNTDAVYPTGSTGLLTNPLPLIENPNFGGDFYSSNPNDAGMRVVLPGFNGILTTYFVRVRSASSDLSNVDAGESNGEYQLQIRLRQVDEEPGSTVRHADIRYATDAIYLAGLPAHSPLINETVESNDNNDTRGNAQVLGNLLTSERNTIGVSGDLTDGDIDFYQFELTIEDIQSIGGVNAGGKTWATIFDIDYADGLGRADTTLSVFDSQGRLIFVSRESNVEDDQPGAGEGADADDLTRGSFGTLDPYIGSVHMAEAATYYVAVTAHTHLASALQSTYDGSTANALVRLEPINSLQRVIEDHIGSQGYSSNGVDIEPDGALFDITDPTAPETGIDTHVTDFNLSDVVLFTTNGLNLSTIDPQFGDYETDVGDINGINTNNRVTDIVMRSDGRLFGIAENQFIEIDTAGIAGNDPTTNMTVQGTTNIPIIAGNQTIPAGFTNALNNLGTSLNNLRTHLNLFNDRATDNTTASIQAMTFARVGFDTDNNVPIYELYYVVSETGRDNNGNTVNFQKLYEADPDNGAIIGNFEVNNNGIVQNGFRGYLADNNATTAADYLQQSDTAGTPRTGGLYIQSVVPGTAGNGITVTFAEHAAADRIDVAGGTITISLDNRNSGANAWNLGEIVDAINDHATASQLVKAGMIGTAATNGYQAFNGDTLVTGGATGTPDFNALGTIQGIAFNDFNVDTNPVGGTTPLVGVTSTGNIVNIDVSINDGSALTIQNTHAGMNFTGAALGPQNLYESAYSNYVFATTSTGELVAFDSTGTLQGVFGTGVADDGSGGGDDSVDANIASTGIAFSPLDFNLWHTTQRQGTTAGHGINAAPDNSRVPSEVDLTLDKSNSNSDFDQADGAISFYFGLEQFHQPGTSTQNSYLTYTPGADNSQYGIFNNDFLRDLTNNSSIGNNVNLPGGALGSLTTNSFSLDGYQEKDAPTLYFSYFLETENTDSANNVEMRDSARAFISTDGGTTWILVATNNSTKSNSANDWELPTYITHTAAENTNSDDNGREFVQELFDNTGVWRQARIDLSEFAGENDLMLRFDYSTAGTVDTHGGNAVESDVFGNVDSAFDTNRRGQNNTGEGFYIDDIIIGSAERGEMVTNADAGVDTFIDVYEEIPGNSEPDGVAGTIVTGSYNLEIRRASEYAVLISPTDPLIAIAQVFDTNDRLVEEDGLLGDDNFRREQGIILVESNQIHDSTYGIRVQTVRGDAADGEFPHQGGTKVLPTLNTQQIAPGAVIQNNLIVSTTFSGVAIQGDIISPESVSPLVKVVNNTIYDALEGITVTGRVSPTIVNNIISNTVGGIVVDPIFTNTVVVANLFHENTSNGTEGTRMIQVESFEALFVDAAAGNFYLADNSKAIDSSLNRLADRPLYAAVKNAIGIPPSDIFAPSYDAFGQLRVDDPTQSPPPGLGSNVFKDRGAIERADFVGPVATITLPPDNDVNGVDLDPDATEVYVSNPEVFSTMIVELKDSGIGVDDNIVSAQFVLTAETSSVPQRTLVEGVDYFFSYNANTNEAIFTAAQGLFGLDTLYTITLDNSAATGIKDLAGNSLNHNQPDLSTRFTILVTDGENDPPVNNYGGIPIANPDPGPEIDLGLVTDPGLEIEFSSTSSTGNVLSVTDTDAFLGTGIIEVTLTTVVGEGILTAGMNPTNATVTSVDDYTIIITGLLADVNAALDGIIFTPEGNFHLDTTTLTMTTSDLGNFDSVAPEIDTDIILIEVTDFAEVSFSETSYTVNEEDGTVVVQLERDKIGLESTVYVNLTNVDTTTADFDPLFTTPIEVTFLENEFFAYATIELFNDEIVEHNEVFTLELDNTGTAIDANIGSPSSADVTIIDTDTAEITFVDDDLSINEEDGTVTFTVQISNAVDENVSFDLSTQDGTSVTMRNATDENLDDDYTSQSTNIMFAASSIPAANQDFVVTITNDDKLELDELFNVAMSNLFANGLEARITLDTPAQATILDDSDTATIDFVNDTLTVNEEDGTVTFTVQISNAIAEDVSLDLNTQDGSSMTMRNATDENTDDDYTSQTQSFTFLGTQNSDPDVVPGTQDFVVTIVNDDKLELDEVFNVFMSNLNANGLNDRTTRITLDTPAQATIIDDTDIATIDFVDDDLFVNEEDGTVTFTVQISNAIAEDVSFDLTTQDGTSVTMRNATDENMDDDYTSKTQSYTLLGTQDTDVVPATRDLVVTITNDEKLELDEVFNVFLSALNANGLNDRTTRITLDTPAQATILDDSDTATIDFVDDDLFVNEEDGTVTFTVQISNAIAEDVSFDLTTQDGTSMTMRNATDENTDDDYTSRTQSFTFLGTQNSDPDVVPGTQDFVVTIVNDDKLELDEVFNVFMSNLNANGLNDRTTRITLDTPAQATILDDSDTATIDFVDDDLFVNEEDGTVTFTVQISNAIAEDVGFDITTQDGTSMTMRNATDENIDDDYTSRTQSYTLLGTQDTDVIPGSQDFVVTITNDDKLELDEVFNVFMSNLNANGLNDRTTRITLDTPAQATILDDSDTATIDFVNDDLFVNEEDGTVTFTVQISNAIAEDVSFDISTQDGTLVTIENNATDENSDDDYTSTTETKTFLGTQDTDIVPTTRDLVVTITNDDKLELDEVFNVFLSNLNVSGLNDRTTRITLDTPAQATILDDSDTATIEFVDDDIIVNEEDGSVTFAVQISNAISVDVSLVLTTEDGTSVTMRNATDENSDNDYTSKSETVTFSGTVNSDPDLVPAAEEFIVTITNDSKLELDEVFDVFMSSLNANGLNDRTTRITLDTVTPAQATILDDSDTATIDFVDDDLFVNEEDGTVTFTVQISNAIAEDVSFDLTTQDGTSMTMRNATDQNTDNDYTSGTQSFTFLGTQNSDPDVVPGTQDFVVTIVNDDKLELDEVFNVFMSNLNVNGLNDRTTRITLDTPAQATIIDDSDVADISFIDDDITVNEEGTVAFFTVWISNAIAEDVSFDLFTQDGTSMTMRNATDENIDDDYTTKRETITFLGTPDTDFVPGIQTFVINITNDDKLELDEVFNVLMDNLVANGLESRITLDDPAQVTIVDDSDTATISFVQEDVLVDEEDGSITFNVQISNAIAEDVSFDLTTRDGAAPPVGSGIATNEMLDNDYLFKTQNFLFVGTPNTDNVPGIQSFTVTIIDDDKVELDELFNVFMDNLSANGLDSRITLGPDATGVIRNTDSAVITIDPVDVSGKDEGTGSGTTEFVFNVNLSNAVDTDVSFNVSTQDNTATVADNDYIPVIDQFFTFLGSSNSDVVPGQQTFTVQIPQDNKVELDEIFDVILTNLNSMGRNVTFGPVAHGTIINDDSATISINNVSQLEADGEFFFTATISNPVDTNISVEVYTEHSSLLITDNDYNVVAPTSPIILNFTPTGALTQNFTITVNDDNIVEGDEFFSTILANLDNALRDVSILNGTNQGHIQDDDSATLSITPVTDTENNSPFQFLVELSNPVDVAITVDASTIDGSAFAPSDYQAIVNQLLTFNPGITQLPVNVTVTNDATTEGPETFEVILENLNPNGRAVFLTSIAARSNSATSDAAVAVDVVGDFAYIADRDGGLQIFNIADPSNPFHVGEYDFNLQGIAQGIDVVGNLAYMAVGEAGLQILDISDPTNPTFVGSIATPARARGVEVIGNLAYVADDSGNGGGLQIIDVTDPTNPTSVGSFGVSTPGGLAGGVKVIGNIAYVTDGNNGLQIVDVSVPATPVQILNVATPGGAAIGLDVVGNFAYVANREGGLQVIDISDPFTASIVGTLNTPGIATGVRVVGNFAYVADGTVGLQVVDITNPTTPTIARTHNTPGGARSLFVQGTLAYVADTFNGLEILEFFPSTSATGTILDPSGPPLTGTASANTKINTSLVLNATTTDANGETAAVPESEQWIDEWDSFWVEVWGNTSVGSGISGGTFDLEYNTDYFTATAVEYGTAFGNSTSSTIDDQTGTVSGISGQNNLGTLGSGNQVLLARIKFESTEEDGVAIDQQTGFLGPHSLGIKVSNAQLDVTDYGGVTASIADSPETDLWAVPFDLDDNGAVNFRDLVSFVSFYGTSVFDSSSGLAWSLDFDKNGQINFRDLTYLINNYGLTKASGQQVAFPPNFPQEWYGSSITAEGEDSLDVLIEAAVDEWKTATGNEELAVQVVVTDLGGQQLGEGHILELDENGIPIKGRVYIDDDAAGLGWYSSVEGLSFDSNGQAIADSAAVGHYDLYTVLLHEIGHAAGFTTSYSAFTDHVVNNGPGQVQFVGWDFVAPLTDDGLHIDESYSPNDVLGATLDPSTRKMISSLDVRILQAAYENATGASITPLTAPLMAADETSTNNSSTTSSAEAAFASTAISQTGSAPVDKQEYPAKSVLQPEWSYAQPQLVQNSIMSIEQSTNLDQLAGSLIDVSYETEQYLTDEFGKIKTEESAFQFDFAHEFEMEDIVENDVVDEELDSLFTEWAGPLV
ncbi:Calx-beta domain-containing protein [Gimesia alba]|uniref:Calx-beta domain-containing protein n=1 Tax=Gimesia alba TaxID=2527973 RepID=UPI0018D865DF|nr:Calx-beta domain-containing protein [Gimesia alba]